MKKEMTKSEAMELDAQMKKFQEDSAINSGNEYFDNLIHSLNDLLEEAERAKRNFTAEVEQKDFGTALLTIESSTHRQMQFNSHVEKAMRASSKLTNVFNIERW